MAARRRERARGDVEKLLSDARGAVEEADRQFLRAKSARDKALSRASLSRASQEREAKELRSAQAALRQAQKTRRGIRAARALVAIRKQKKDAEKERTEKAERKYEAATARYETARKKLRSARRSYDHFESVLADTLRREKRRESASRRRQKKIDERKPGEKRKKPAPAKARDYEPEERAALAKLAEAWMSEGLDHAAALLGGSAQVYRYPSSHEVDGLFTLSVRGMPLDEVESLLTELADALSPLRENVVFYSETYFQGAVGFVKEAGWKSPDDISRLSPGGVEEGLFFSNWFLANADLALFTLVIEETGQGIADRVEKVNDAEISTVEVFLHWNQDGKRPERSRRVIE